MEKYQMNIPVTLDMHPLKRKILTNSYVLYTMRPGIVLLKCPLTSQVKIFPQKKQALVSLLNDAHGVFTPVEGFKQVYSKVF